MAVKGDELTVVSGPEIVHMDSPAVFAEVVGQLAVGPFVSKVVFAAAAGGKAGDVKPVIAVVMPSPVMLNFALNVIELLTAEGISETMKTDFEKHFAKIEELKGQAK
jgi:hypothetical protein